jgi:large subunit ribosomal protein L18
MNVKKKREKRYRRHKRVRGKVFGSGPKPRLCVFRSSKHIYAQIINDKTGKTLASVNDLKMKARKKTKISTGASAGKKDKEIERTRKLSLAFEVGELIAKQAKDLKINEVVFDRGGYKYHGRVKSLAEGARAGGLKF